MANVNELFRSSVWDFEFLFDLIKTSIDEGKYEVALKLATIGLNEAINQSKKEWQDKFDAVYFELKNLHDTKIKGDISEDYQKNNACFKTVSNKQEILVPLEHGIRNLDVGSCIEQEEPLDLEIKDEKDEFDVIINFAISNFLSDDTPVTKNLHCMNKIYQGPDREVDNGVLLQKDEEASGEKVKTIEIKIDEFHDEVLEQNVSKCLGREIKMAITSSGFEIIPRKLMNDLYEDMDVIAFKLIKVKEFLDIFLIVPVKISALKGRMIVSEMNIDYLPNNGSLKLTRLDKKLLTQPYFKKLERVQALIFKDLSGKSKLTRYISNYLKKEVIPQKTASNKTLFLRTGQLEHVVLIDPVLVSVKEPGCAEKSIKFPYQKSSNTHVVRIDGLPKLLDFLESKYFQLEKRSENSNSIHFYFDSLTAFVTNLRLAMIPFLAFGFTFLVMVLFQVKELFQLLANLAIACSLVFTAIGAFLYYNFYRKKSFIKKEFNTPYFKRPVNLTESSLLLIKEELSPETMKQFIYECYGKKLKGALISVSEEVSKKKESKTLNNEIEASTGDIQQARDEPSALIKKYSSFLED